MSRDPRASGGPAGATLTGAWDADHGPRVRMSTGKVARDADVGTAAMMPVQPSMPASPFSLTPAKDDTALFLDARIGFGHLVPGRPAMGHAPLRPGEPPADAVLHLQDAPISIRYRLEAPSFAAASAAELARATAERWAALRSGAEVQVDFANETWLWTWGVEAAAVASYGVGPQDHEELFVLVRHGMVLHVTWSYPRGLIDDPAYAAFASVAEATMTWDPARCEQRGRVWPPDSAFLGPGLYGAPRPKYNESAKQLALAPLSNEERAHLLAIVAGVISGAGAPWVPVPAQMIVGNKRALLGAARDATVRAWIEAAFADVVTAHDLRGLAIMLGRAIDGRRTSSAPPPEPPAAR